VSLALGLGRTIVDDGVAWNYAPNRPAAPPPVASPAELADITQHRFWAVNMGRPPEHDPIRETEYLVHSGLDAAAEDGTLSRVVSTFDPARDRLTPGLSGRGARVIDFAPVLQLRQWPINDAIRTLLDASAQALAAPVEIEFAITIDEPSDRVRVGFLQVRPMLIAAAPTEVSSGDLTLVEAIVASDFVLGNGCVDDIRDVIYVRPETFNARDSRQVAIEISQRNQTAVDGGFPYLLIGFGRWGTADPWLGIPVTWPQIAGARAIVEAMLPGFHVELSQGSHFFHNISSAGVSYFGVVPPSGRIDWTWLESQPAVYEGPFVRHIHARTPIRVRVDGRSGRGVVVR
jgi:hypothetical protein